MVPKQLQVARNFTEDTHWSPGHSAIPSQSNFFHLVARNFKRYRSFVQKCPECMKLALNPGEPILITPLGS